MTENKDVSDNSSICSVSEINTTWNRFSRDIGNVISSMLTFNVCRVKGVIRSISRNKFDRIEVVMCDALNNQQGSDITLLADLPFLEKLQPFVHKTVLITAKPVIKATNMGYITNLQVRTFDAEFSDAEQSPEVSTVNTGMLVGMSTSAVKKAHEFPAEPNVLILSPSNGLVLNDIKNVFVKHINECTDSDCKKYFVNIYNNNIHEEHYCFITDLNSVYAKLKEVNAQNKYNVLIIARGGSDKTIADIFNNEAIISELVQFDGYIMTGIGHSDSLTLTDCIANECYDTPASLATFFHSKILTKYRELVATKTAVNVDTTRQDKYISKTMAITLMIMTGSIALYVGSYYSRPVAKIFTYLKSLVY